MGTLREKLNFFLLQESLHGEVTHVLDGDIVVSEFELQSCSYVHFRTNPFGKGMNSLMLSATD